MIRALFFAMLAAAACGQNFEVASVKPSPPVNGNATPITTVDNAGIRLRLPLQKVICMAYQVRMDQVAGPAWLATTSFDIEATLPKGATEDQVPSMLQNLLADRFEMTAHRESRERPVYALVVAKGGPKMKAKPADGGNPLPPPPSSSCAAAFSFGRGTVTGGDRKTAMGPEGMRAEMSRVATLIDLTTRFAFTDRPVIDKTDLQGGYDIRVDFPLTQGSTSDPVGSIDPVFLAALDKLGLKLEPQRAPIETIVIDHIERTPTEN